MARKLCQAFVERTQRRCEKTVRCGTKYCWWHYPKAGMVLALVLGLLLPLLLNAPLTRLLSQYWPFRYLDQKPPIIFDVSPDITRSDHVDANTIAFGVTYEDDCAGVESVKSDLNISYMGKNGYRIVGGKLARKHGRLDFTVDEKLKCGEYLLRITLCDKAKNTSESKYSFVVPEDEILTISARYEEYEESKHKALVPAVLSDRVVPSADKLYVYYVNLHNRAQKTYCRSLYVTIDIEGVIWRWEETGSADCKGVVSASTPESMTKSLPKERVFGGQEMMHIEEMAPGGLVNFRALVGVFNIEGNRQALRTPTQIEVFGTYVSDGYRRTTTVDVRRKIPVLPGEH